MADEKRRLFDNLTPEAREEALASIAMLREKNTAFPAQYHDTGSDATKYTLGLTKREFFAAMAMQGFIAHGVIRGGKLGGNIDMANCVAFADALMAELEKSDV